MKRLSKIIYWAACFVLTSGLSTYAAETTGKQVVVNYADLNLAHREGAQSLLVRLERAASHVCGGNPQSADLQARASFDACHKDAMDRAVTSVHAPLVASLYGLPQQPTMVAAR